MTKLRKFAIKATLVGGALFFLGAVLISVPPLIFTAMQTPRDPEATFRGYVLDPIPESVTNIRAHQPKNIGGYMYTLRFNVNRSDLNLIIESRSFQRVWIWMCTSRAIDWHWDRDGPFGIPTRGQGMSIYGSGFFQRPPRWFRPGRWDNPEAYAFYKIGDYVNAQAFDRDRARLRDRVYTKVLLYNEKKGEAYCIVSRHRP